MAQKRVSFEQWLPWEACGIEGRQHRWGAWWEVSVVGDEVEVTPSPAHPNIIAKAHDSGTLWGQEPTSYPLQRVGVMTPERIWRNYVIVRNVVVKEI